MNTIAVFIVLSGYLATAQRTIRQRTADSEAGVTLEQVVITVGLLGLAILAIAAIAVAVNRRIALIN
ncbi:MAG: hypothetical protein ACOH2F_10000 [Cellulomonas sp.]